MSGKDKTSIWREHSRCVFNESNAVTTNGEESNGCILTHFHSLHDTGDEKNPFCFDSIVTTCAGCFM